MKRPLQAVVDTNVIVSITRAPSVPPNDELTAAVERRRLQVCADREGSDREGGIVGEWQRTAKPDVVRQLIIHWQQFMGWKLVDPAASLPAEVARALARLGFRDTVDKLILRTALNTKDKRVVTNDPDFWDPKDTKNFGKANAPVAKLCRERLGIRVSTLKETVDELSG